MYNKLYLTFPAQRAKCIEWYLTEREQETETSLMVEGLNNSFRLAGVSADWIVF